MAETKHKGDIGEAMLIAEATKRGYKVAIPFGEDWRCDLIVERKGKLEKVQCKYTESDGEVVHVYCKTSNASCMTKYTKADIDWLAVYDKTTDCMYFIDAEILEQGKSVLHLRLTPAKRGKNLGLRWAKDYVNW